MDLNKINEKLNKFSEKLNEIGEQVSSGLNQGFSSFDNTLNKGIETIGQKVDDFAIKNEDKFGMKEIYSPTDSMNNDKGIPTEGLGSEVNVMADNIIKPAVGVKLDKSSEVPQEYQSVSEPICQPIAVPVPLSISQPVSVSEPISESIVESIENGVNLNKETL